MVFNVKRIFYMSIYPSQTILKRPDCGLSEKIYEVISTLKPNEKLVVVLRFGLFGQREHSLKEIGEMLRYSKMGISRTLNKALHKLRHPIRSKHLWDFVYPNDYNRWHKSMIENHLNSLITKHQRKSNEHTY